MATIRAYHRPTTLDAALELLSGADGRVVPLGGGTAINGLPEPVPDEVVDLQALGLSSITRNGDALEVGATATLRDLVDNEWTPPSLRDLAIREAPNTIRNAATIGGTVAAAHPESGLFAGLLVYSATVAIARASGVDEVALSDLGTADDRLAGLITSVRVPIGGEGAFAATARTPADTPIVLVAGHRSESGSVRLAATGIAGRPVVFNPDHLAELAPPSDFRGSAAYRLHLTAVLADRVAGRLAGGDRS